MKNTFLLLGAGLILSVSAQAQKKKSTTAAKVNVPESVTESFKGTYANVEKNKWNKTYTGNYVAVFTNTDSLTQEVEYNTAGVVIKTKTIFKSDAIPENVSTAVETKYTGAKVVEAAKMEIPGVNSYYKVKIETATNLKKELLISEEGVVTE